MYSHRDLDIDSSEKIKTGNQINLLRIYGKNYGIQM